MKLQKAIANAVIKTVLKAECWTSLWGIYQPQEPKAELMELKEHQKKK